MSEKFFLSGPSGSLEFSIVESEKASYSAKVTSNPLESGAQINDHMQPDPPKIDIQGYFLDDGGTPPEMALETIEAMRQNRDLCIYSGALSLGQLVITAFTPEFSPDIGNGFSFSMSLQRVEIASSRREVIDGKYVRPQSMSSQDKDTPKGKKSGKSSKGKNSTETAAKGKKNKGSKQTRSEKATTNSTGKLNGAARSKIDQSARQKYSSNTGTKAGK